nr:FAD-dependent oxidoreductase [Marivibrio halodurans]
MSSSPSLPKTAIVIGAGAVGVSCALQLAKRGVRVTVIDRGPVGGGTSHGNAGAILRAASPVAGPDVIAALPRMLLDPKSPLSIRWRYLPRLTPWLMRFLNESRPSRVRRNADAIWQLGAGAVDAWRAQVRGTAAEDMLRPVGWLKVYESEASFEAARPGLERYRARGTAVEYFDRDSLRQLEPNLAPLFARGALHADALFALNPRRVVEICADAARALGVTFRQAEVSDAHADDTHGTVTLADGERLTADRLVLACGAWSKGLAKRLGASIPLDTERGYHLMFETPERGLNRPVVWEDKGFVLCPMAHGLRMTSQVELAGVEAPPDFRRIERLLPLARRMLPSLAGEPTDRWLGYRPSTPDSVPVVGVSPRARAALFAFGHQHYGLSLAARTGEVIADMALDRPTGVDESVLSPSRYG